MIVQKEFTGGIKGRSRKYDFSELTPGTCKIFDSGSDIENERHKISCSLYQYKRFYNPNWKTAVRIENGKVCVYRIS